MFEIKESIVKVVLNSHNVNVWMQLICFLSKSQILLVNRDKLAAKLRGLNGNISYIVNCKHR